MTEPLEQLKEVTREQSVKGKLRDAMGENAPDAIVIIDRDGKIWLVNAETVKLFLYSRDELDMQEVEILMPERFREDHKKYRLEAWKNQVPRSMGGRTLVGMNKYGEEFQVDIEVKWFEIEHGIFGMAALRKPRTPAA